MPGLADLMFPPRVDVPLEPMLGPTQGLASRSPQGILSQALNQPLPMEGRLTFLPAMVNNGRREFALPGLLASAWNAFTAPGRAYSGNLENPEAEALNFAGMLQMGAMPSPAVGGPGTLGMNVYHGTQAVKRSDLGSLSTEAISGLKGNPGGMKIMDGLGPHVGTADAANARLAKNKGLKPATAFNKPRAELDNAYVMPFEFEPQKAFTKKDGSPFTEVELQSRLAAIGEKLGFKRYDLRHYSSNYPASAEFRRAQEAIKKYLLEQGYDSIPYVNSHEARGSISHVVLRDDMLRPFFDSNLVAERVGGQLPLPLTTK